MTYKGKKACATYINPDSASNADPIYFKMY